MKIFYLNYKIVLLDINIECFIYAYNFHMESINFHFQLLFAETIHLILNITYQFQTT